MTTVIMTEDPRLTDGRPPVVGTGAMATRGEGCVQSLMSAVEHLAEPARTDNRRLCARARLGTCHEHDASTSAAPPRSPRPLPAAASKGQDEKLPGARERESNVSFFAACLQSEASERERRRGAAAKLIGAKKPSPLAYPRALPSRPPRRQTKAHCGLEVGKRGNGKLRGWGCSLSQITC